MKDHHQVSLDDLTLTRLPVGIAEGHLWITFIVRGLTMDRFDPASPSFWRPRNAITITQGKSVLSPISSGGGGGEQLSYFHLTFNIDSEASLVVTYRDAIQVVDTEIVTLPRA